MSWSLPVALIAAVLSAVILGSLIAMHDDSTRRVDRRVDELTRRVGELEDAATRETADWPTLFWSARSGNTAASSPPSERVP